MGFALLARQAFSARRAQDIGRTWSPELSNADTRTVLKRLKGYEPISAGFQAPPAVRRSLRAQARLLRGAEGLEAAMRRAIAPGGAILLAPDHAQ